MMFGDEKKPDPDPRLEWLEAIRRLNFYEALRMSPMRVRAIMRSLRDLGSAPQANAAPVRQTGAMPPVRLPDTEGIRKIPGQPAAPIAPVLPMPQAPAHPSGPEYWCADLPTDRDFGQRKAWLTAPVPGQANALPVVRQIPAVGGQKPVVVTPAGDLCMTMLPEHLRMPHVGEKPAAVVGDVSDVPTMVSHQSAAQQAMEHLPPAVPAPEEMVAAFAADAFLLDAPTAKHPDDYRFWTEPDVPLAQMHLDPLQPDYLASADQTSQSQHGIVEQESESGQTSALERLTELATASPDEHTVEVGAVLTKRAQEMMQVLNTKESE